MKSTAAVATSHQPRTTTTGRSDRTSGPTVPDQPAPSSSPVPDPQLAHQLSLAPAGARAITKPAMDQAAWLSLRSRWLPVVDAVVAASVAAMSIALLPDSHTTLETLVAVAGFVVVVLGATATSRCYDVDTITQPSGIRRVSTAALRVAALLGLVGYLTHAPAIGPLLLVALPVTWLLISGVRFGARARLRRLHARGLGRRKVIVIGTERASAELIRRLDSSAEHAFAVVGVLTEMSIDDSVEGVPVLGTAGQLRAAVAETGATTVLVAPWSPLSQDGVRRLSWESAELGVEFFLSPNVVDVDGRRLRVEMAAGVPFLNVRHPRFGGAVRRLQSLADRSLAVLALVLLSPLLAATALAVRMSSSGGAIFRQERVGQGGKPFVMYKFRSMTTDAEARRHEVMDQNKHGGGPLFKAVTDPRITSVGRILRRFSLDELPQLWNVAKGDMALVGPRPPLPQEVAEYDDATLRRLLVRPGLTGLWQVSGRSDLPWDESVRLDLYYVDNRTVTSDLAIIGRTGSAVFAGRGAY